jgi:hypothetical protein
MRNGLWTVPKTDSVSNKDTRDVVGNKADLVTSDSIAARVHSVEDHNHSASNVYPTLDDGVAIPTHADPWTLGVGFTEVIPNAAIGDPFDLHFISIEALDDNAVYEIVLYAVEVEIARVRVTKNAVQDGTMNAPVQTVILAAGTQIQARAASDVGNSSVTLSLFYHIYT